MSHPPHRNKKPLVLVVEDEATNRLVVGAQLRKLGFDLEEAVDGAEAVELGGSGRFDVILMDLNLPIMDGFAATELIHQQEVSRGDQKTPVIALTAWVNPESRRRSKEAGMAYFVAKPVTADTLTAVLGAALRDAGPADEVAGAQSPAEPVLDLKLLDDAGGPDLVREALGIFLSHSAVLMDRISPAAAPDIDEVVLVAHTLKGSSLAIGAAALARSAEELEHRARRGDLDALAELKGVIDARLAVVRKEAEPYVA